MRTEVSLATLIIPFVAWPIVFGTRSYFWIGLATATTVMLVASLLIHRQIPVRTSYRWLLLGVVSGVVLYGAFYAGFQATKGLSAFSGGISSVYELKDGTQPLLIATLLIFPIGPGEEVYWRGLIQRTLEERLGRNRAWIVQAIPYTLIHLFTLNLPLTITALAGGLVWGYGYKLSGSLTPSILSHIVFDLLIFVVLPFG